MGRQGGGDPTLVSSSIALLQEWFRQLQKVREKREGKELLKLFSESNSISRTIMNYEPNRLPFQQPQPEVVVILPYKQPPMDDFRAMTVPAAASTSLMPTSATTSSTSTRSSKNSDVDSSLRL